MDSYKVTGIIAAPCTAFKTNGDINTDPDLMDRYIKFLQDMKITGVYTTGTNGEGPSLTVEERKAVTQLWIDRAKGKLTIIAHVGGCNQREAIELAAHAGKVGVDAFACMVPSFFKAKTEEAVVSFLEPIAAAAPTVPFYYYDINFLTGVYLNCRRVLELGKSRIPNLKGAKYSCREMPGLFDTSLVDGMQVMSGTDDQFLPILSLGVDVPIVNGYVGTIFYDLYEAYKNGDMKTARKHQERAIRLSKIREAHGGGIGSVKAIMKCFGFNLGPARLPEVTFTDAQVEALRQDLKKNEFI
ncbi:N-acetylneuraminate lyase [Patella vulgata]|uniref:N-acetylneuraminate lyase n=1 Tax=Patella vulgata TaxID=6465 RepID=UPI0024A7E681|nr:N-acetylneuraminate lyase [Patella vulgata]